MQRCENNDKSINDRAIKVCKAWQNYNGFKKDAVKPFPLELFHFFKRK